MVMEKTIQNGTKLLFRLALYLTLMALFGIIYAKDAFRLYMTNSASYGQRQESIEIHEPPVLILCPEPAFKPSFFLDYEPFAESFFWGTDSKYRQGISNETSMLDVYANMSWQFFWQFSISVLQ